MSFADVGRLFRWLRKATPDHMRRFAAKLTVADLAEFDAWFELWAHRSQLPPKSEGWRVWLMMAGRGFGKTRAGAEWIYRLANNRPGVRIALVGATIADARAIMVEGVSGLLAVAKHHSGHLSWEPSLGRLKWPNGSEAQLFSGDHADGLRGPEHDFAWVLTFEVVADEAPPLLGAVLQDASAGLIDCDEITTIGGYAAMGPSISAAIEPIVEAFGIDLLEEGSTLRSPSTSPAQTITEDELGCCADNGRVTRFERAQTPARSLPSSLSLSYYERQRDYQLGLSRSDVIDHSGSEAKIELPGVLGASDARTLTEDIMARHWTQRDKFTVRLPPRFVTLEPGRQVALTGSPTHWQVQRSTIEGFVAVVELRPVWRARAGLPADPGRVLPTNDIVAGELSMALVELPDLMSAEASDPILYLAASTPTPGWKPVPVEVSCGAFLASGRTANRKAVLGQAVTTLVDDCVEVRLIDENQWLNSCDDLDLASGANLALVGDELIQFADVQPLGAGRFRLTRLLRGRVATQCAKADHAIGDLFLLISPASMIPIPVPAMARGCLVSVTHSATGALATASRRWHGRVAETGVAVIAPGSPGTAIDLEARRDVARILEALRGHGVIET